jgi:hypothetical protein
MCSHVCLHVPIQTFSAAASKEKGDQLSANALAFPSMLPASPSMRHAYHENCQRKSAKIQCLGLSVDVSPCAIVGSCPRSCMRCPSPKRAYSWRRPPSWRALPSLSWSSKRCAHCPSQYLSLSPKHATLDELKCSGADRGGQTAM